MLSALFTKLNITVKSVGTIRVIRIGNRIHLDIVDVGKFITHGIEYDGFKFDPVVSGEILYVFFSRILQEPVGFVRVVLIDISGEEVQVGFNMLGCLCFFEAGIYCLGPRRCRDGDDSIHASVPA